MHPRIALDGAIVARNLRAWRDFAGVPVRPVIKCNGYNWGVRPLIAALDSFCDSYCVADCEELLEARRFTNHPIVVLGNVPRSKLGTVLDADGIPNVSSEADLAAVLQWCERSSRRPRLRVGVLPAAGFSGIDLAAIDEFAASLAASQLEIEVWTHITDATTTDQTCARVAQAVHSIRSPGGRVVGTDVSSTYALSRSGPLGTSVRVGIGLFGATGGTPVPGVRCALQVVAPVTSVQYHRAETKVGYGPEKLGQDGHVVTARCGYGDGLPKGLAGATDILSVGMQYVTMRPPYEPFNETHVALLDEQSDLDAFAARAGQSAHEIVTAFGRATTGELVSS
ncbi:MAG: alanine racemase [Candidatus Eremiobacteraeota bacterium]|nr:alanine racemase [Candidatus Eremiobacteraeota bacterium]